ncbi:HK97 gp10 family phage protein [Alicyclobacillus sp. SO9]|uniref:HK97 gp10 family phage protein n=1 Tax=Alicyclobacillus sp. SO9 TaxID=2665646 RepID=UPI0018E799B8|nr:HK97 gp10 family phage protein [Alicyclobacillus sp. SO9]QQE80929.1 HK97 gp10 family phage protein [Alicyclobacillus sp. SO9]
MSQFGIKTEIPTGLKDAAVILDKEVLTGLRDTSRSVAREAKRQAPEGVSGTLRRAINGTVIPVAGGAGALVSEPIKYGPYVEYGTRPHMPPVDALKSWTAKKFRLARESKANKRAAWALAMKIKRSGTRPNPFMGRTFFVTKPFAIERIQNAIERAVERMSKE